jgi:hypothetical protein
MRAFPLSARITIEYKTVINEGRYHVVNRVVHNPISNRSRKDEALFRLIDSEASIPPVLIAAITKLFL